MARFGLIALMVAAICGVLLGFHSEKMSWLTWVVLAAAAVYGSLSVVLPERMLKRRIITREPMSFDEIYQRHFINLPFPKTLLANVWREAAADLKLDAERLRPTDRFGVELAVRAFPLVDLSEALTARWYELRRTKKRETHPRKLKTLGEYIELCGGLKTEVATPVQESKR